MDLSMAIKSNGTIYIYVIVASWSISYCSIIYLLLSSTFNKTKMGLMDLLSEFAASACLPAAVLAGVCVSVQYWKIDSKLHSR